MEIYNAVITVLKIPQGSSNTKSHTWNPALDQVGSEILCNFTEKDHSAVTNIKLYSFFAAFISGHFFLPSVIFPTPVWMFYDPVKHSELHLNEILLYVYLNRHVDPRASNLFLKQTLQK